MVRFYWYGLTVIYRGVHRRGMLFGSVWGTAGMIVGIAFGATAAAGFAMFADKSEGRENAFYAFSRSVHRRDRVVSSPTVPPSRSTPPRGVCHARERRVRKPAGPGA
jgi:hypothetical protein